MTQLTPNAFPPAQWGKTRAVFVAAPQPLPAAPVAAALAFVMQGERFVLADIAGRGWCVPGGRLEAGESAEDAVRREAWEEAGATLGPLRLLGHYILTHADDNVTLAAMYLADATRLDPLPPGFESRGVRAFTMQEIPAHYYTWDALLAAVFKYAREQGTGNREQELPPSLNC